MVGTCAICGLDGTKKCGACKAIIYCSVACQKADWKQHKSICKKAPSTSGDGSSSSSRCDGPACCICFDTVGIVVTHGCTNCNQQAYSICETCEERLQEKCPICRGMYKPQSSFELAAVVIPPGRFATY